MIQGLFCTLLCEYFDVMPCTLHDPSSDRDYAYEALMQLRLLMACCKASAQDFMLLFQRLRQNWLQSCASKATVLNADVDGGSIASLSMAETDCQIWWEADRWRHC